MAGSVNRVILVGNLGADPEIRTTTSGDRTCNLRLATSETWRDKNTGNLERQTGAPSATFAEALMNVMDCWLDVSLFDSRFEFAVRSWALQSDALMVEVQQADERRLAALTAMFMRYGFDPVEADVKARTFYLTQIGYITMQARETLAVRMQRIPAYVRTFTGTAPTDAELAAFHARHGFLPGG